MRGHYGRPGGLEARQWKLGALANEIGFGAVDLLGTVGCEPTDSDAPHLSWVDECPAVLRQLTLLVLGWKRNDCTSSREKDRQKGRCCCSLFRGVWPGTFQLTTLGSDDDENHRPTINDMNTQRLFSSVVQWTGSRE